MKTVQWVDPIGKKEPLRAKPGTYQYLSLSPDGRRVALAGGSEGVWVYDPQRDTMTRLSQGASRYFSPIWSADGHYVVFGSYSGIVQAHADAASQPQALTQSTTGQVPWSFTSEGNGWPTTKRAGTGRFGRCRWRIREGS